MSRTIPSADLRDVLAEVAVRDQAIDGAVHDFLWRTDPSFFDTLDTLAFFGARSPQFARLCQRMTNDAREVRAVLTDILRRA